MVNLDNEKLQKLTILNVTIISSSNFRPQHRSSPKLVAHFTQSLRMPSNKLRHSKDASNHQDRIALKLWLAIVIRTRLCFTSGHRRSPMAVCWSVSTPRRSWSRLTGLSQRPSIISWLFRILVARVAAILRLWKIWNPSTHLRWFPPRVREATQFGLLIRAGNFSVSNPS